VPNLTHLHPGTPSIYLPHYAAAVYLPGSKGLSHLTLFYTLGGRLKPHPFSTDDDEEDEEKEEDENQTIDQTNRF